MSWMQIFRHFSFKSIKQHSNEDYVSLLKLLRNSMQVKESKIVAQCRLKIPSLRITSASLSKPHDAEQLTLVSEPLNVKTSTNVIRSHVCYNILLQM